MPIRDVGDAMDEMRAGSKRIKTRDQAVAAGLEAERRLGGRKGGGRKMAKRGKRRHKGKRK